MQVGYNYWCALWYSSPTAQRAHEDYFSCTQEIREVFLKIREFYIALFYTFYLSQSCTSYKEETYRLNQCPTRNIANSSTYHGGLEVVYYQILLYTCSQYIDTIQSPVNRLYPGQTYCYFILLLRNVTIIALLLHMSICQSQLNYQSANYSSSSSSPSHLPSSIRPVAYTHTTTT